MVAMTSRHGPIHGSACTRSDQLTSLLEWIVFAGNRSRSGQGSSSTMDEDAKRWKTLWSTKAPGKMNITLWRFAHDCLPCGHQLQKRKIPARDVCVFCNQHETIGHALLFCQFADEVWRQVRAEFPIQLQRRSFRSPRI